MKVSYENKVAIVTGGASGMGAALVRLLAEAGGKIVIGDLNPVTGAKLAAELGERVHFVQSDVTKVDDCQKLAATAAEVYGGIDVLFNNAGNGDLSSFQSISLERWNEVLDLNLNGTFRVTKAALPYLKASGNGAVVNTCSISGMAGDYGMIAYNTAKGGLLNMTRCLALDLAKDKIRVNAICPGIIADTQQAAPLKDGPGGLALWDARIAIGRTGKAVEVARVMAFVGSDLASYMTGAFVVVDGGMLAHTGIPTPGDFAAAAAAEAKL
jgi:meso-butanediol dehydrogenase / (S,S)-butanediol dehydrogenase / diacetyl reductase